MRQQAGEDGARPETEFRWNDRARKAAFAHMANDELQSRKAIEQAGNDETKSVQTRFGVPSPACD